MSNVVAALVVRNQRLRGAINPATDMYKLFDLGKNSQKKRLHRKRIYFVLRTRGSCVSCAPNQDNKMLDSGGPASTTKATSSGVLCMDVNHILL